MIAVVRKEINITPQEMAEVLVHDSNLEGLIEDEMINMLADEFGIDRDDAGDAVADLTYKEFIKILEAVVEEMKKSL